MVGTNIIKALHSNGIEVFAPSRKELDLTEKGKIGDFIFEKKPDAVIHCAGLVGGIHANMSRPFDFLQQNLSMGSKDTFAFTTLGSFSGKYKPLCISRLSSKPCS